MFLVGDWDVITVIGCGFSCNESVNGLGEWRLGGRCNG